nr:hypothetical protein [Tanacetum cinerariifolium]
VFELELRAKLLHSLAGRPFGLGQELHHERKKRRLRAREVVRAAAVGHVAVAVDEVAKIGHHVAQQRRAARLAQA